MIRTLSEPPPGALQLLEEDRRKRAFFREHWDELAARYPDQFVAVKDGEVIIADADLDSYVARRKALGLSHRDVWMEYIAVTGQHFIL